MTFTIRKYDLRDVTEQKRDAVRSFINGDGSERKIVSHKRYEATSNTDSSDIYFEIIPLQEKKYNHYQKESKERYSQGMLKFKLWDFTDWETGEHEEQIVETDCETIDEFLQTQQIDPAFGIIKGMKGVQYKSLADNRWHKIPAE